MVAHLLTYNTPADITPVLSVQNGTNAERLSWTGLDFDYFGSSFSGYQILRSTDNVNFFAVNSTTTKKLGYLDLNVQTGAQYYYKVVLVSGAGLPVSQSQSLLGIPLSGSFLNWKTNLTGTYSAPFGVECLPNSTTGNAESHGSVFVDGLEISTSSSSPELPTSQNGSTPATLTSTINPELFSNGTHTVVMTQSVGDSFYVTMPMQFSSNCVWTNRCADDLLETGNSQFARITAQYTGTTTGLNWSTKVQVMGPTGTVVRNWITFSSHVDFSWDGKDDFGVMVSTGTYKILLAGDQTPSYVNVVDANPQILVMVRDLFVSDPEGDYAQYLATGFKTSGLTNGVPLAVLYMPDEAQIPSLRQVQEIKRWLLYYVTSFYIYCHGTPTELQWGNLTITNKTNPTSKDYEQLIDFHSIWENRRKYFHFIYLDACNTSGKNGPSDYFGIGGPGLNPGDPVEILWEQLFPLEDVFTNTFMGTNGRGLASHELFMATQWDGFRRTFWYYMWQNWDTAYAVEKGIVASMYNQIPGTINPSDTSSLGTPRIRDIGGSPGVSPLP